MVSRNALYRQRLANGKLVRILCFVFGGGETGENAEQKALVFGIGARMNVFDLMMQTVRCDQQQQQQQGVDGSSRSSSSRSSSSSSSSRPLLAVDVVQCPLETVLEQVAEALKTLNMAFVLSQQGSVFENVHVIDQTVDWDVEVPFSAAVQVSTLDAVGFGPDAHRVHIRRYGGDGFLALDLFDLLEQRFQPWMLSNSSL